MRATPPPIALPVAAAVTSVLTAVLALLAIPSAALAERWLRPVPGEVARAFHFSRGAPFTAGAHRGADLAAPPGTAVRAACAGTVLYAARVPAQGGVVTLRCGGRRVTHLPLASIAVRTGAQLRAGATLGTLAPGHRGLHLGVRAAGDPFGYVDPLEFLPSPDRPLTPITARPRRGRPRAIRVPPRPGPPAVRLPRVTPRVAAPAPRARLASLHTGAPPPDSARGGADRRPHVTARRVTGRRCSAVAGVGRRGARAVRRRRLGLDRRAPPPPAVGRGPPRAADVHPALRRLGRGRLLRGVFVADSETNMPRIPRRGVLCCG